MIEARELRKSFGELRAVAGVSFEVRPGETLGLLGPNGAGKTTTIHMLVGALRPDSGSVHIDGQSDPTRSAVRRRLGICPQKLSLYAELSGEENLEFFGKLYGLGGAALKQRIDWALEFAGLADRRHDRLGTYSGGMQRRLNLACALVHDPKVIFLDEPTVGVDPQSRNHIFESIESLKRGGRTMLYTTHYMEEAERLCDRVAVMDHGRILDVDTVDNLIARHGGRSRIVAELEELPAAGAALPVKLEGRTLRMDSDQPMQDVAQLAGAGLKLRTLHVDRANLETVFLNLTGRTLRD